MSKQNSGRITKASLSWLLAILLINWGSTKLFLIPILACEQQESASSQAQQEKKSAKPKETESQDTAEAIERDIQQALQSLYQASDSAKDLPDPVFRIRSYAAIAEAVWDHDRPFASNLFRTAFEETKRIPKPERPRGAQPDNSRTPEGLRQEVLAKVARLDLALATEMTKSLEPGNQSEKQGGLPTGRPGGNSGNSQQARALMNLANSLLEKDPKTASEAAAATLSEGVTTDLLLFMMRLKEKDRGMADLLFNQTLRATSRNNPPSLQELTVLGSYAIPGTLPVRLEFGSEPLTVNPA